MKTPVYYYERGKISLVCRTSLPSTAVTSLVEKAALFSLRRRSCPQVLCGFATTVSDA